MIHLVPLSLKPEGQVVESGIMPGKSKFQISRSLDERIKRIVGGSSDGDSEFAQVTSAYILGFNYGNVTNCVGLTTNYQLNHAVFPVVGLVFFKSHPTDEDIKSRLKQVREYSCSPNGLGSFKSDKNEHLFLIYSVEKGTNEVDKRIFNFTKSAFVRRQRLRLNILDDPFCPRQVHRGSEELFNLGDTDSSSGGEDDTIDHLVFFIHGVGGVCDVRFRSCVEVVADFKKMVNNLLAQQSNPSSRASTPPGIPERSGQEQVPSTSTKKGFFRKYSSESSTSRASDVTTKSNTPSSRTRKVECLPVSWHSCTRKQTGMNDQLNLIALSSVPKLRLFLNKVVLDALLYGSGPVYCQTIINNVGDEINRLYTLFMERHPNFTGSISLAGHSLGSVILFDLLAHQIPSAISDDETQQAPQSTCNNENNNNNINDANNNNGQNTGINNMRKYCLNICHDHKDLTCKDSEETHSCSDYANLEELLKDMDLTQFTKLFQKEHIDLNTLLLLTDLDMKDLNLPLGARRKLGTYINFKKVSSYRQRNNQTDENDSNKEKSEKSKTGADSDTKLCKENNHLFNNMYTGQYLIKYPQLKFKPKCFFVFGSPMPMFLNVRGVQEISKEYKLPTCDRMFNIFHPYDPLAYRIEPLIDPRFKGVEPILIPHHRGGKRIHVQLREGFAKVGHDFKHRVLGSLRDTWSSITRFGSDSKSAKETVDGQNDTKISQAGESSAASSRRKRLTKSASSSVDVEVESFESVMTNANPRLTRMLKRQQQVGSSPQDLNASSSMSANDSINRKNSVTRPSSADEIDMIMSEQIDNLDINDDSKTSDFEAKSGGRRSTTTETASTDFDPSQLGKLNGGRRIDYVLQEKPIELFNEYIFAFTSHASYWQNEDSALILLKELYKADNIDIFDQFD